MMTALLFEAILLMTKVASLRQVTLPFTLLPPLPALFSPPPSPSTSNQPTAALSGASIVKFASQHQRSPFYTVKVDSAQFTLNYSFTPTKILNLSQQK